MKPMSSIDRSMLEFETSSQPLHVLATIVIQPDDGVDADEAFLRFRRRVHERLPLVPAFWTKPARAGFTGHTWIDDPELDIDAHIFRHHAAAPGDITALGAVAGAVASTRLPRDRPLWELHFVDGLDNGRVAVITKVHHAVLDGVSGFATLASFFDFEPDQPPQSHTQPPLSKTTAVDRARGAITESARWGRGLPRSAAKSVKLAQKMLAKRGDEDTALPLQAPTTMFNGSLTPQRSIELTEISLADVKSAKDELGVSVNDVVVAVCTRALRSWLETYDTVPERPLVAAVPVSERELGDDQVGNRFSTLFYRLPVHLTEPLEQLEFVARSASAAKDLHHEAGTGALQAVADLAPMGLLHPPMELVSRLRLADRLAPPVNLVISNVAGPPIPMHTDGGTVAHLFPMGPLVEGSGLNITVASYLDRIGFGFQGCTDMVTDLEHLALAVPQALRDLVKATE